jgi:hypothetical protein
VNIFLNTCSKEKRRTKSARNEKGVSEVREELIIIIFKSALRRAPNKQSSGIEVLRNEGQNGSSETLCPRKEASAQEYNSPERILRTSKKR